LGGPKRGGTDVHGGSILLTNGLGVVGEEKKTIYAVVFDSKPGHFTKANHGGVVV